MLAGVRPDEFWELTPCEFNLIMDTYQEKQKELFYRDLRNDFYTGCFAQVQNPNELYEKIIEGANSKPQTGEEMFNFLKSLVARESGNVEDVLESRFEIPLSLTPEFKPDVYNYIVYLDEESIEIYLPDVSVSLNGTMLNEREGKYTLRPGLVKVNYNEQVYSIVIIRR
jgi:hypothetical protein